MWILHPREISEISVSANLWPCGIFSSKQMSRCSIEQIVPADKGVRATATESDGWIFIYVIIRVLSSVIRFFFIFKIHLYYRNIYKN